MSQTNCPLAEKCPYYKKIKSGEIKLADAVDGCPYLNSRSSASHHGTAGGDASECPFMKKKAKDAADKDKMKAHDEL